MGMGMSLGVSDGFEHTKEPEGTSRNLEDEPVTYSVVDRY